MAVIDQADPNVVIVCLTVIIVVLVICGTMLLAMRIEREL